jgi:CRISPR-associated protein Cas1
MQALQRNAPLVIETGIRMLAAKVNNQSAMLKYFAKYRRKTNILLANNFETTAGIIKDIALSISLLDPEGADVRHVAMGHEGRAAAIYWQAAASLVPNQLAFGGRITKGASDLANQCLNYIYSLLYSEVWLAVARKGLDPYFGIMHGAKRDQGSLIFDLIEEFRPHFADRIVFSLFGRGFLPLAGKDKTLRTKSRKQLANAFIKQWRKKISWRGKKLCPAEILEKQVGSLAGVFLNGSLYKPYRMKW